MVDPDQQKCQKNLCLSPLKVVEKEPCWHSDMEKWSRHCGKKLPNRTPHTHCGKGKKYSNLGISEPLVSRQVTKGLSAWAGEFKPTGGLSQPASHVTIVCVGKPTQRGRGRYQMVNTGLTIWFPARARI